MLEDAKAFWKAIEGKVRETVRDMTGKSLQCERFDVTTAPNAATGKIGVRLPFGDRELKIPYSGAVSGAKAGDTVLVVWWKSMSNAKAWFFGDGPSQTAGGAVESVNGQTGTVVLGADDVSAIGTLRGTAIPAGADLNDYTDLGDYYVVDGATAAQIANVPESGAGGILKVIQGNVGSPIQRIQIYLVSGYSSTWLFMRRYYNGTWGAWYQFTNSYVASGTVTGNGVTARWYRNGRNCFVSVSGTLSAAVAANAAILTGLPGAMYDAWARTSGGTGLSVGSAGSLRPAAALSQGAAVYASFSYITA